eukprot:1687964-Amphidinium_carterae.1
MVKAHGLRGSWNMTYGLQVHLLEDLQTKVSADGAQLPLREARGGLCTPGRVNSFILGVSVAGREVVLVSTTTANSTMDVSWAMLESMGNQEEKIFNKYACWCEKASMAKAEAIETAEDCDYAR